VNESRVRAVVAACTTTTACVLPVFLAGGLAVQMGDELDFSAAGLGVAVAVYFAVSAFASVPAGRLVERFGPTVTARAAVTLAAACLLAIAGLARSYPLLVALLAVGGIANALGQLASNASLAVHVRPGRQGLSFGVKQAAIPVSQLLAGASVPLVALTVGWRWAFVIAAAVALAAAPLVPAEPRTEPASRSDAGERATGPLILIGLAATLASGAANAMGSFLVDASAGRGLDPGLAGLTLALGGAICVASRLTAGWFADRLTGSPVGMIAALLVAGSAGVALLAVPGEAALVAGVVLGFGFGWAWPGLMNFAVVRLHPQAPAAATSITQTGVYAGGSIGPLAFGFLAAAYGYPRSWLAGALAMLAAAALMIVGARALFRHAVTTAPAASTL
jgi:MFS family permease